MSSGVRPGAHDAARPCRKRAQDAHDLAARRIETAAGVDDKVRPGPLGRIRHLAAQDGLEPVRRHAGTCQDAGPLHRCRCTDHDDDVAPLLASALKQERNVEDHHRPARRNGGGHEVLLRPPHQRVNDGLEPFHCGVVAQHPGRQGGPVDHTVPHRPRKSGLDRWRCHAAIQRVHRRVGVVHRHAGFAEYGGRRRFSHADRAGHADYERHRWPSMSSTIRARSSGVTVGVTPNQRAKPGTAW